MAQLNALLMLVVALAGMSAVAATSPCENVTAEAAQLQRGDASLREWLGAQAAGKDLSLVALKRKPPFLESGAPCDSAVLIFDRAQSVLNLTRRCHVEGVGKVAYGYSFNVCESKDVAVATRPLARQTVITSEAFRIERRRVAYVTADVSAGPTDAYRTRRVLHKGTVLDSQSLELRPAIERKQLVVIRSIGRGFSLELTGVALADGWVGDVVRVRSKMNGDVLDAKVERAGVVRIDG